MESNATLEAVLEQQQQILEGMNELKTHLSRPEQEWFSVKQAAAYLGVNVKSIRRAIKQDLPASNLARPDAKKALCRISRKDLNEWAQKRRVRLSSTPADNNELLVQEVFGSLKRTKAAA
jgi:hypothetical protein